MENSKVGNNEEEFESELDELLQLMDAAEKFLHKLLGERKWNA